MAFHTFGPGLALDRVTMAPLPAVVASLEDAETGEPVQAYSMDDESLPVLVATNRYGYFGQFKVPAAVRRLRLTFAGLTLEHTAWELVPAALDQAVAARDEAELAKIAAQQAAALVAAPADTVVKTLIQGTATQTRQALDALYMGKGTLGLATPTADGLMPKADKAKLNGLGGLATSAKDGLMPKADKAKLDNSSSTFGGANSIVQRNADGNVNANGFFSPEANQQPQFAHAMTRKDYVDGQIADTVRKNELVYNVKDFGAKGNGATDDTAAINAAISAAATAGKVLVLPAKTFKISSWLRAKAGTVIDARGATIALHIQAGVSDEGLLTNGAAGDNFFGYAGNGSISIIGGTWDARGHINTASFSNGFALGHATNISLTDVTIKNIARGHGLDLAGSKDTRIANCSFSGYTDRGSPRGTEAIQLDLTSATGFPLFGNADNTACKNVIITGCTFTESAECGAWPRAIGSHGADKTAPMADITVTGCTGVVTDNAIRAFNWIDFTITGNVFTGGGIYVLAVDEATSAPMFRGTISGNVLREVGNIGIWLAGKSTGKISRCTIANNIVEQTQASTNHAVSLEHANGNTVTGNVITGAGSSGINLGTADDNILSGNRIEGTKSHGINVNPGARNTITGNHIRFAGGHGISCSTGGADNYIGSNLVTNCSQQTAGSVGIRVNGMTGVTVALNIVRSTDGKANNGVSIAGGASNTNVFGNDLRGSGPSPFIDQGTGTTSAQNLV